MRISVLLSAALLCGAAQAASFDCGKAASADEIAICANPSLLQADDMVNQAYMAAVHAAGKRVARAKAQEMLEKRKACAADVKCIADIQNQSLQELQSIAQDDDNPPADPENILYYGSRAGMEVTVRSRSGLGTKHAVIVAEHTLANAENFCREYGMTTDPGCVDGELKQKLQMTITADCKSGTFNTFYGAQYVFQGRRKPSDTAANTDYVLRETDGDFHDELDGTTASGYDVAIDQFKALCPNRF
jgi:uncharacterized protein